LRQTSHHELSNQVEKEKFENLIRQTALSLFRNYNRNSKQLVQETKDFVIYAAKSMDGRTFTLFNKYLHELKHDVLGNKTQKLSADSFMVFLDKIRSLSHSQHINDLILNRLAKTDIKLLESYDLLQQYQEHSIDFKFEESLREGEIKQFA
jgi:hypothetical protein